MWKYIIWHRLLAMLKRFSTCRWRSLLFIPILFELSILWNYAKNYSNAFNLLILWNELQWKNWLWSIWCPPLGQISFFLMKQFFELVAFHWWFDFNTLKSTFVYFMKMKSRVWFSWIIILYWTHFVHDNKMLVLSMKKIKEKV